MVHIMDLPAQNAANPASCGVRASSQAQVTKRHNDRNTRRWIPRARRARHTTPRPQASYAILEFGRTPLPARQQAARASGSVAQALPRKRGSQVRLRDYADDACAVQHRHRIAAAGRQQRQAGAMGIGTWSAERHIVKGAPLWPRCLAKESAKRPHPIFRPAGLTAPEKLVEYAPAGRGGRRSPRPAGT